MKKKKLKKRIIYQSDTDMIRRTVQEISRIAGRNLLSTGVTAISPNGKSTIRPESITL